MRSPRDVILRPDVSINSMSFSACPKCVPNLPMRSLRRDIFHQNAHFILDEARLFAHFNVAHIARTVLSVSAIVLGETG